MIKILCAANAIKEVMTAQECLDALMAGAGAAVGESASEARMKDCLSGLQGFLMSDGGDGFLEAMMQGRNVERRTVETNGPLGDVISADYLYDLESETAYLESAESCGLRLVEPARRNVLMSGTAGLADVLVSAKESGAKRIYVGLGGSATCDGGVGFLWRLACLTGQFRPDACEGRVALDMADSASPDVNAIREWLEATQIKACADVDAVLLGAEGAAQGFAVQKGATEEQVDQLEAWMGNWANRVETNLGQTVRNDPGAGAAGGLGFALAAMGAEVVPGAITVAEKTGLQAALASQNKVLVTEGVFDMSSLKGKAPWAVAKLALQAGAVPVIFCGMAEDEARRQAESAGIVVVEFAAGIAEKDRVELMPGMLTKAVAQYLKSAKEQPV